MNLFFVKLYAALLNILMSLAGFIDDLFVLITFPLAYTNKMQMRLKTPFGWAEKKLLDKYCALLIKYQ